ncbi:MAG: GNAT family N-acetyltransferase [Candidatus Bathyarchaeia archaeon]|jgi:ribosomal protein S18 acetylase RimI-like enzyme
MRVVSVEDGFERVFWDVVNKDPLNYYFFIFDWTRRREQTRVLLAMEDGRVVGAMLIYTAQGRDDVVQLRGSRKAVEQLLESVDFERVELQAPVDCEEIVLRRYRPWFRHVLVLMCLKKGEENLQVKHALVKLGVEDVGEVVDVMRGVDPEVWGDLDVERQKLAWKDAYMLGIRQDNKLVSVGLTRFVDIGSNVGAIATDKAYRNRGFATSIVSALAEEILKRSPPALIHVLSDNAPAVQVYSKVGFKPCKQYILVRAKRIID